MKNDAKRLGILKTNEDSYAIDFIEKPLKTEEFLATEVSQVGTQFDGLGHVGVAVGPDGDKARVLANIERYQRWDYGGWDIQVCGNLCSLWK